MIYIWGKYRLFRRKFTTTKINNFFNKIGLGLVFIKKKDSVYKMIINNGNSHDRVQW